ncbi:MAG TPA: hypothetical protein VJN02_07845 [Gammaproteobacteria bacterium]|nr:hypothetical protein [Gammaproteobacteria bacterium]
MQAIKTIGKREFIQHTSKYLKWVAEQNKQLIITHQNKPDLIITKIRFKSLKELRNFAEIIIHGDINEPVLPGYDEW